MKPKTMILMTIAIVCGLGASYMTTQLLAERQTVDQEKVKIYVAKKNLNMGDAIKVPDELFEEKEYLKGMEPRNAIANVDEMKNRVLKRALRAGDFVTPEDMFGEKDGPHTLQFALPDGFRAIGIRVNQEAIASGFSSLPMSRVDLISTVRRGDDKSSYSQILLEDVLVVAADTSMHRDESGKPMPANVVTVAVKPEDALKVALATQMGTISLVLRKLNDNSRSTDDLLTAEKMKQKKGDETEVVSAEPAKGGKDKEAAPPLPEPVVASKEPSGKKHVLVIYEGDNPGRRTDFLVDPKTGEVITPLEVNVMPLAPPAPAAPATPPKPTAAPTAAPPAPGGTPAAPPAPPAPKG